MSVPEAYVPALLEPILTLAQTPVNLVTPHVKNAQDQLLLNALTVGMILFHLEMYVLVIRHLVPVLQEHTTTQAHVRNVTPHARLAMVAPLTTVQTV